MQDAKDIITEEQRELLLSILASAKEVVVVGHKNPDGDALGSCLAMAYLVRTVYGANVSVVVPDNFPEYYQWLPDSQTIINYERKRDLADSLIAKADTIFFMDLNSYSRMGEAEQAFRQSTARKVMIDHHLDPDIDCLLTISRSERCSTCEVLFAVVSRLGLSERMDKKWASMIYCGMMTDTGGFTYNSSRPEIYSIIGELLAKRIDKDKIYRLVYNNFSQWAVRFRGYIMAQKLCVFPDLHASYFTISRQEMLDYHFNKGDAEGLVNVPLTIKGMRLSVSLREDDRVDNRIWVSIRSVDDFPCNEMAEQFFNGGGHLNAAGGHLFTSLAEAETITRRAIKAFAERLKK
ncbi:MAG: DHH family phosphoesterase [Prevotella sp.]|nr:DHH family phosphoesterase [Prevotella sp.]